ncbi:MAG: methyltransferase domain-containing protein [Bacillota bacterium]|nr:methyltransferase domain-containing protein [Bacillota bacterium]
MSIKRSFDDISESYDKQRKQLIPCFDDFYNVPLSIMNCKKESPKVLDIGAGTGLFSSFVLGKYPNARITLIDLSDKMLEVAKKRFFDYSNFEYVVADYTKQKFDDRFDIIISALSIHHLSDTDKEMLYKKCYYMLEDGGVFINADQVLSTSLEIEKLQSKLWKHAIEKSGLSKDDIKQAYDRISYDNPSTLAEQLKWLKEAGFKHVDSIYKYYHFCVMYAKK